MHGIVFHLQAIPTLGIMDYVINNPSLHRVHHGRNRYCIDKNYGAVFSFWDWLFGKKAYYSLTQ
jgi:alkylglycerol monooxygenase